MPQSTRGKWNHKGTLKTRGFFEPSRYLLLGGVLFVGTELSFSLSIGYAANNHQAIEVSMINYLWPTFTMIASILLKGRRATWLIFPGVLVSAAVCSGCLEKVMGSNCPGYTGILSPIL
ncbi:EamA family transporter [Gluconobacter sp. R71646]|uniref:EamA family transporter n=1 Tax=Gluconobacter potus TaxID=2724927 RepID=A0ABR9YQ62_9PROT|nr:EamA family transporter [Gluconobacter sp. R71656]MBF0868633.1 EamA family transporter [Gluconobacter sp. R75628]MBF0874615.1 EamA family transporter [Gluconobacter sp. R75629]MBF0883925.1 EamA family transporter [Gluconobacter potus]